MNPATVAAIGAFLATTVPATADVSFGFLRGEAWLDLNVTAYGIAAQSGRIAGGYEPRYPGSFGVAAPVYWDDMRASPTLTTRYYPGTGGCCRAITPDGRFAVGRNGYDPVVQHVGPFMWDLSTRTAIPLAYGATWYRDSPYAVSADAGVVVGQDGGQAVIWAGGQRSVIVPSDPQTSTESAARAVSADGSRVAGYRGSAGDGSGRRFDAFVWSQATGAQTLPSSVPGATSTAAMGISASGETIVGYCGERYGEQWPTTWTANPVSGLFEVSWVAPFSMIPDASQLGIGEACISPDGSTIGGRVGHQSCIWSSDLGLQRVVDLVPSSVLEQIGMDGGHMDFYEVTAIGGDNRTIVGNGLGAMTSEREYGYNAWALTIPSPGAAVLLAAGGLFAARRRGKQIG